MKNSFTFILLILLFGLFLRLYHVADIPNTPLVDEASIGYNAYSILHTGKDEHGVTFPLTFKAFGDQKLPAYIYSTVPSVAVFGLNNFAVRLPSAIIGTLLILVSYLLLKELKFNEKLSLFGSLITATAPWMIMISRFGYESNMGLLFFAFGLYFLIKGYRRNHLFYLLLGGIFLGFTWYCYIAFRLVSTCILGLFMGYTVIHRKLSIKSVSLLLVTFILIVTPYLPSFLSKTGTARLNQIGLFSNAGIPMEIIEDRTYCTENLPKLLCYEIYQKPTLYSREMLTTYSRTFSLEYLFLKGEEQRFVSIENFGLFYVFLAPFYIYGLISLLGKIKEKKRVVPWLIGGALLAALPSVIANGLFRVRLTPLFPFLLLLLVEGLKEIGYIKNKFIPYIYKAATLLLLLFSFLFLIQLLAIHTKKFEDSYYSFIPDTMHYLINVDRNTHIYIQDYFLDPPIFYAYYAKIDPSFYQHNVKLEDIQDNGFQNVESIGNFNVMKHSPIQTACLYQNDKNALIVSKDKMETVNNKAPLYNFISKSGLPSYSFIYRIQDVLTPQTNCKEILKSIQK